MPPASRLGPEPSRVPEVAWKDWVEGLSAHEAQVTTGRGGVQALRLWLCPDGLLVLGSAPGATGFG